MLKALTPSVRLFRSPAGTTGTDWRREARTRVAGCNCPARTLPSSKDIAAHMHDVPRCQIILRPGCSSVLKIIGTSALWRLIEISRPSWIFASLIRAVLAGLPSPVRLRHERHRNFAPTLKLLVSSCDTHDDLRCADLPARSGVIETAFVHVHTWANSVKAECSSWFTGVLAGVRPRGGTHSKPDGQRSEARPQ
jgi:hypothetical protein